MHAWHWPDVCMHAVRDAASQADHITDRSRHAIANNRGHRGHEERLFDPVAPSMRGMGAARPGGGHAAAEDRCPAARLSGWPWPVLPAAVSSQPQLTRAARAAGGIGGGGCARRSALRASYAVRRPMVLSTLAIQCTCAMAMHAPHVRACRPTDTMSHSTFAGGQGCGSLSTPLPHVLF